MDIHSPSLPKQPKSTTEQSLHDLIEERTVLEGTIARLIAILDTHGVGIRQLDNAILISRHVDPSYRPTRISSGRPRHRSKYRVL